MPCSPLSNTLLGGHLPCRVTLCHSPAICPKAFGHLLGGAALKWGPFLKEASGLHMAQLGTCLGAPGEELLPKAVLHFHSQTPAQPRTAKAPLKASRTEERFGSHSSSACLRFEREDSLFKAGTCSDRAEVCASLTLLSQTAFVERLPPAPPLLPPHPRASRTQKLSEGRNPRLLREEPSDYSRMFTPV